MRISVSQSASLSAETEKQAWQLGYSAGRRAATLTSEVWQELTTEHGVTLTPGNIQEFKLKKKKTKKEKVVDSKVDISDNDFGCKQHRDDDNNNNNKTTR